MRLARRTSVKASPPEAAPIGWNLSALPMATVLALALIALGLGNVRMRRRFGRVSHLVIALPLWIAGLFALFNALSPLLPANL